MLGDYGEVYVLDWGVAKVSGEEDGFDDLLADGHETGTGVVIGTRAFMSPEQAAGRADIDARTDVFALGRILANILVAEPDRPPELVALCQAATEADRDGRIASARELGDHVQRYLDGDRDLALRPASPTSSWSRPAPRSTPASTTRAAASRSARRAARWRSIPRCAARPSSSGG